MMELKKSYKKLLSLAGVLVLSSSILVACNKDGSQSTGGPGRKSSSDEIVLVTREEGSGTRGAFVELTGIEEKKDDGSKVDRTSKEAITQMKTSTVITSVEGNEKAIGYISTGSLSSSIKALTVDGVEPTSLNIKSGDYKIARPFNIATKGEVSDLAKDFINFILSKEGQEIVSSSYIAVDSDGPGFVGESPSGKIVVAGSSSVTPVMEKLREGYLEVNPNGEVEIQESDSSAGMQSTIDGVADIGMASRELKDSEKEVLTDTAIALDGIAVIVNKDNPLNNISMEDVKLVFIGEKTLWNELE